MDSGKPYPSRIPPPTIPTWPAALATMAAACALGGGAITLAGWALDIPRLTDWKNDGISMFPNPAVCAVLSGIALLVYCWPGARRRTVTSWLGVVVSMIGGATLLEHITGVDLGIDTLLAVRPWGQLAAAAPMRMGPPASISFLVIGAALALLDRGGRARSVSTACGVVVAAIAALSFIGRLYGAPQMYTLPTLTGIALQTASLLLALGIGLVASTPDREPMRTVLDPGAAGIVVRQALPIVAGFALVVGWLRVVLESRGVVDTAFVTALATLAVIALTTGLLWWAAARVRAHEQALREREAELRFQAGQLAAEVTERKRAEEARALLVAIVEASDDAIVSKTLDGVITSWNVGAERIFGYSRAEAVGRSIDIIIPADRLAEERDILRRLRRGERIDHYETVRRTKDGRLLDISLTFSPVKDRTGNVIGASKIARDISDRKRVEAEREESNRRKDEFIAILAHELRNPLAPMRTAARHLKLVEQADPHARRQVDMIERQVAQMSRLIDDLLDVSRISRGALELRREHVTCSEIVEAAVDACSDEIRARGHRLEVNLPVAPVELQADRERLVQVLCNLIGNAVKYTPAGGNLDLMASVVPPGTLEVSIKDDGIGIPAGKLTEIFELFARVDDSLESQGGLGIGLTLVRQLAELHGGTIEARSNGLGHGSEFVVRLPVVVAAAVPTATAPEPGQECSPLRILVADDNEDAAESLMLLLQLAGHDVHVVFDGEAAVAAAARLRPDVALLDIGMPRGNGYEVARRIREQPWGADIHLVALTGWGQQADKRHAEEAGFDVHLVKPVSPEALERLLASVSSSPPTSAAETRRSGRA
jgi:PAS domain S-box-containing protein